MNILDAIVNAQDGAAVRQLGSQVGLAPDQATTALSALVGTCWAARTSADRSPLVRRHKPYSARMF
jgi:hypothetical protein